MFNGVVETTGAVTIDNADFTGVYRSNPSIPASGSVLGDASSLSASGVSYYPAEWSNAGFPAGLSPNIAGPKGDVFDPEVGFGQSDYDQWVATGGANNLGGTLNIDLVDYLQRQQTSSRSSIR